MGNGTWDWPSLGPGPGLSSGTPCEPERAVVLHALGLAAGDLTRMSCESAERPHSPLSQHPRPGPKSMLL